MDLNPESKSRRAAALVLALHHGETVYAGAGYYTLKLEGDDYVMRCRDEEHRIDSRHTTSLRLLAHWDGFRGASNA